MVKSSQYFSDAPLPKCPVCGAPPLVMCHTKYGRITNDHAKRVRLAAQLAGKIR